MFEKLLESEPENMEAMKALLYKKMRRGKTEKLMKYVEKLMKLEPHEVEWKLLNVLVDVGLKPQGQFEEGLKIFQPMVNDNPQRFSDLTFGLCQILQVFVSGHSLYSLMDKKEEAAQQFEIYWSLVLEEFPQKAAPGGGKIVLKGLCSG